MVSELRRELGLPGAVITGLGSILGTGAFVAIALAHGSVGSFVVLAAPLAAMVAVFNGLSSAALASAHPMAGGTYEYGSKYLGEWPGFLAGWLFLIAKSASAATAALALGSLTGLRWAPVLIVAVLTVLVASGLRRTTPVNLVLVAATIAGLVGFVVIGATYPGGVNPIAVSVDGWQPILEAVAFLFVAYTGYGRIATLGEEVRDPSRTIPRAVIVTLAVTAVLYTAVGWAVNRLAIDFGLVGESLTEIVDGLAGSTVVLIGAVAAMGGVLLNLILGLSRVWLAMGRRHDMPRALATVTDGSPRVAVVVSGVVIAGLTLIGDLRVAWSFSAFSVLLYYAITNAAALKLDAAERRFPRWTAWAGLASCLFLSIWLEPTVVVVSLAVIGAGVIWRAGWRQRVRT
ncbi:MAG TPA: APC family permease [Acidimicrobiia bacterium]|nr:APC family permease [Acidimicrobiia bacterium]